MPNLNQIHKPFGGSSKRAQWLFSRAGSASSQHVLGPRWFVTLTQRFPCRRRAGLSHSRTRFPFIPAELNSSSHGASPLKCLGASRIIRLSGKTEIFSTHSQFPKNRIIKPAHEPSLCAVIFLLSSVLCFTLLGSRHPAELSSVSEVFSSKLLTAL